MIGHLIEKHLLHQKEDQLVKEVLLFQNQKKEQEKEEPEVHHLFINKKIDFF